MPGLQRYHTHDPEVIVAMDVPLEWAKGTLRVSVGRMTTEAEIDKTIRVVAEALRQSNCAG